MTKIVSLVLFFFLTSFAFAQTCPTIKEIKTASLSGFKVYDTDKKTPLTAEQFAMFKNHVEKFLVAEWIHKNNSAIHCYYGDRSGSLLEAYLVKDNLTPKNSNHYWYQVTGSSQCAAGVEGCQFASQPIFANSKPHSFTVAANQRPKRNKL